MTRTRVLSEASAFQMVTMLQDVLDHGTGTAARTLGVRFPAGGKTGTTDDFKDAWFVGFSSSMVVGVWVGLDQPAPIGPDGYGARYALPIWSEFMREAARIVTPEPFQVPNSVSQRRLCRLSHLLANGGCPGYTETFQGERQRARGRVSLPSRRLAIRRSHRRSFPGQPGSADRVAIQTVKNARRVFRQAVRHSTDNLQDSSRIYDLERVQM